MSSSSSLRADLGVLRSRRVMPGCRGFSPATLPNRLVQVASADESTTPVPSSGPHPPGQQSKTHSKTLPENRKPYKMGGQILHDYRTGYEPQFYEYDYYIDESWIEGKIPEEIRGTFYSICPGLSEVFGSKVRNPDDADGMVASFSFGEGRKVFFRNRFVRTPTFQAEQAAGRRMSRGLHDKGNPDGSWLFNPLDLTTRSAANSGLLHWANKLYALSDHALPHQLNKLSLDTLGESDLGGLLSDWRTMAGSYRLTPTAAGAAQLTLMSSQQSGPEAWVRFMELDVEGKVQSTTSHRVSGCIARMLGDFLVTENYYIMIQSPLTFNVARFMGQYIMGEVSFAECIDYEPGKPALVHLIPRPSASPGKENMNAPLVLEAPPLVSFSAVNAYQMEGGQVVVADVVAQEGTPFFKDLSAMVAGYYRGEPKPELTRLTINVKERSLSCMTLSHRSFEHATVAPGFEGRAHKHVWATASANEDPQNWGPRQVLTKLNISPNLTGAASSKSGSRLNRPSALSSEVWAPGPRGFLGPPTFVPKAMGSHEDDGWILTMLHNADTKKAELLILDASDLPAGPVASIQLPHHMPHARGGQWLNKYHGPARGASPAWQPKTKPGKPRQAPPDPWAPPGSPPLEAAAGGASLASDASLDASSTAAAAAAPGSHTTSSSSLSADADGPVGAAGTDAGVDADADADTGVDADADTDVGVDGETPESPSTSQKVIAADVLTAATSDESVPEAAGPSGAQGQEPATSAEEGSSIATLASSRDALTERQLRQQLEDSFNVEHELRVQVREMQRRLDRMAATERSLREQLEDMAPATSRSEVAAAQSSLGLEEAEQKLQAIRGQLAEYADREKTLRGQIESAMEENGSEKQESRFSHFSDIKEEMMSAALSHVHKINSRFETQLSEATEKVTEIEMLLSANSSIDGAGRKEGGAASQASRALEIEEKVTQLVSEAGLLIAELEAGSFRMEVHIAGYEQLKMESQGLDMADEEASKKLQGAEEEAAEMLEAADKQVAERLEMAEKEAAERLGMAEKEAAERLEMAEKEAAEKLETAIKEAAEKLDVSSSERVAKLEEQLVGRLVSEEKLKMQINQDGEEKQALVEQLYESLALNEELQRKVDDLETAAASDSSESDEAKAEVQKQLEAVVAEVQVLEEAKTELQKQLEAAVAETKAVEEAKGELQKLLEAAVAEAKNTANANAELKLQMFTARHEALEKLAAAEAVELKLRTALDESAEVITELRDALSVCKSDLDERVKEMQDMVPRSEYEEMVVQQEADFKAQLEEMQQLLVERELGAQLGLIESDKVVIEEAVSTAARSFSTVDVDKAVVKEAVGITSGDAKDAGGVVATHDVVASEEVNAEVGAEAEVNGTAGIKAGEMNAEAGTETEEGMAEAAAEAAARTVERVAKGVAKGVAKAAIEAATGADKGGAAAAAQAAAEAGIEAMAEMDEGVAKAALEAATEKVEELAKAAVEAGTETMQGIAEAAIDAVTVTDVGVEKAVAVAATKRGERAESAGAAGSPTTLQESAAAALSTLRGSRRAIRFRASAKPGSEGGESSEPSAQATGDESGEPPVQAKGGDLAGNREHTAIDGQVKRGGGRRRKQGGRGKGAPPKG